MAHVLTLAPRRNPWERLRGYAGYLINPAATDRWGGPFNGQTHRRAIFEGLDARFRFEVLVETGTFKGVTTEYLARHTRAKIYTVEQHPRYFGYAHARLRRYPNVELVLGDSLALLRRLEAVRALDSRRTFCYLDAHWEKHLPLAEEIDLVYGQCSRAIAMIDDFQVPGDPDYSYDDYGEGRALTLDYVAAVMKKHDLRAFMPSLPGAQESGKRRGSVVLARQGADADVLASLRTLRPA